MRGEMQEVVEKLGTLADEMVMLSEGTTFNWKEDPIIPQGNAKVDKNSIHYAYGEEGVSEEDKVEYSQLVNSELDRRQFSTMGNLRIRQQRLKDSLISEWKF